MTTITFTVPETTITAVVTYDPTRNDRFPYALTIEGEVWNTYKTRQHALDDAAKKVRDHYMPTAVVIVKPVRLINIKESA